MLLLFQALIVESTLPSAQPNLVDILVCRRSDFFRSMIASFWNIVPLRQIYLNKITKIYEKQEGKL